MSPGAARGYTWPPFESGNVVSLKGGHRSPRVYNPLARELAAGLLESRPDLERFGEAVGAWADAEARVALLRRHLDETGMIGDDGEPRRGSLDWLVRLERLAMKHREALGLDPRSEAALIKDRAAAATLAAVDLGELAARGRAAIEARSETAPDVVGDVLAAVIDAAPSRRTDGTDETEATP